MREFFSIISSQIYSRKKIILGGLAIALLLSFVPLNVAEANIFSDILNGIKNLPISLPVLMLVLPIFLITSVLGTVSTLLTNLMLVFAKASMSIGVTPANQELVNIGWTISLNLVNITFILILVFIGLATILRLQTYQLQRTLPLLIIIALLVNFSGVFVGFVVDMSNLIARPFLVESLSFGTFGDQLASVGGSILDLIKAENPVSAAVQLIGQIVVLFLYYLLSTFVMFIIMLLFFARVVILWMLAMLAPIAFACYILPATKRFWTQWLQQLIQWSIIGIPISLFLYLTSKILAAGGGSAVEEAFGSPGDTLAQLIASTLGNVVPLVILMTGVMLSMQLAPAGAQGVINMGKKAGMGAAKFAGQKAWKRVRDRIPEGARKAMERMATGENPTWGKGKTGLGGLLQRSAAGVAGYTRRTTGGIAKSTVIGTEQADAEKAKAKASKQDVISNMKDLRQTASVAERAAIMDAMRQKNQIKDALNPDIVGKENILKQDEITNIYEKAHKTRNGDLVEGLERAFVDQAWDDEDGNAVDATDKRGNKFQMPETDEQGEIKKDASGNVVYKIDAGGNPVYRRRMFSDKFAQITDEMTQNSFDVNDRTGLLAGTYTGGDGKTVTLTVDRASGLDRKDRDERGYASFGEKVIGEAKTADEIKALQKNWWNNDDLMNAAHKFWAGNQTSQAATVFGRDFVNRLEATKKTADWYFGLEERKDSSGNVTRTPRNIAMPRYEASSAAQGLGIAPKEGAEGPREVTNLATVANIRSRHGNLLDAPYTRLLAILQTSQNLEREQRRGAPQAGIDALRQTITQEEQNLRTDIGQAAGVSKKPSELENDWDRIEDLLRKRGGGRRSRGRGRSQQPDGGQPGGAAPTPGGSPSNAGGGQPPRQRQTPPNQAQGDTTTATPRTSEQIRGNIAYLERQLAQETDPTRQETYRNVIRKENDNLAATGAREGTAPKAQTPGEKALFDAIDQVTQDRKQRGKKKK